MCASSDGTRICENVICMASRGVSLLPSGTVDAARVWSLSRSGSMSAPMRPLPARVCHSRSGTTEPARPASSLSDLGVRREAVGIGPMFSAVSGTVAVATGRQTGGTLGPIPTAAVEGLKSDRLLAASQAGRGSFAMKSFVIRVHVIRSAWPGFHRKSQLNSSAARLYGRMVGTWQITNAACCVTG